MKEKQLDLSKFQSDISISERNFSKVSTQDVFKASENSYLNDFNFYLTYFNIIPNSIKQIEIDCEKAHEWFFKNYQNQIKDVYYNKLYLRRKKRVDLDDIFCVIDEDLMVNFDTNQRTVRFQFRKTEMSIVNEIMNGILKFKRKQSSRHPIISLLISTTNGIETKLFSINKPKLNISDNYNDDFIEINKLIIKRLNKKNDKGLVLLHGKPGTGKTSYIRYLISTINKPVIFLPPNMASSITNPKLISILIDNPNSIFVIEDAEDIIIDREKDGCSPVSALLNVSDGLLADCLNIQVICSFNTDLSKIDSALMRKGRLIAKYEFKELELIKAKTLSKKLGFESAINTPMSLASIYNQKEEEFQDNKYRKTIGFRVSA